MKKSEEYLERNVEKKFDDYGDFELVVPLRHAKTHGKIVELEIQVKDYKEARNGWHEDTSGFKSLSSRIIELESEIEALMKS